MDIKEIRFLDIREVDKIEIKVIKEYPAYNNKIYVHIDGITVLRIQGYNYLMLDTGNKNGWHSFSPRVIPSKDK